MRYHSVLVAGHIDLFMRRFTDDREAGGGLIRTHLYLLFGCALPLWHTTWSAGPHSPVAPYAGVIILGVGDAAASMVGVRFGRTKWRRVLRPFGVEVQDAKKSVEGTLAAWGCTFLLALLLHIWHAPASLHSGMHLAWASLLVCLAEAFTTEIDNLTLPMLFLALILKP